MKKRGSPVRYIGFAVLALIVWHHLPHLSHGCHEKTCTVLSSARQEGKALIAKEPAEWILTEITFALAFAFSLVDEKEEDRELFKVTLKQARAPPAITWQ